MGGEEGRDGDQSQTEGRQQHNQCFGLCWTMIFSKTHRGFVETAHDNA